MRQSIKHSHEMFVNTSFLYVFSHNLMSCGFLLFYFNIIVYS
uniref:Uncharacterized protein n=1 Tax=Polysiphonia sp. TaxID=1967842 RepID=A0A1Z1M3G4_9FLOR|nr:hypothetical protein [Polysiphonia sp.]